MAPRADLPARAPGAGAAARHGPGPERAGGPRDHRPSLRRRRPPAAGRRSCWASAACACSGPRFRDPTYHLNEGHAALLAARAAAPHRAATSAAAGGPRLRLDPVRERCVFTTHTPVEAGHDRFPTTMVKGVLGGFIERGPAEPSGRRGRAEHDAAGAELSDLVNGVAGRHAETTADVPGLPDQRDHQRRPSLHLGRTHLPPAVPGHRPGVGATNPKCWSARTGCPTAVSAAIGRSPNASRWPRRRRRLDAALPDLPLLGFARRMTGYKRPDLLFSDLDRLRRSRHAPFQILVAGKAHPHDGGGKELIRALHDHARRARRRPCRWPSCPATTWSWPG